MNLLDIGDKMSEKFILAKAKANEIKTSKSIKNEYYKRVNHENKT